MTHENQENWCNMYQIKGFAFWSFDTWPWSKTTTRLIHGGTFHENIHKCVCTESQYEDILHSPSRWLWFWLRIAEMQNPPRSLLASLGGAIPERMFSRMTCFLFTPLLIRSCRATFMFWHQSQTWNCYGWQAPVMFWDFCGTSWTLRFSWDLYGRFEMFTFG